jgi:hypothetical protein
MKIKIWHDNHANIHSKRQIIIDLEKTMGITDEEWEEKTEDMKLEVVKEYIEQAGWNDYGFYEVNK